MKALREAKAEIDLVRMVRGKSMADWSRAERALAALVEEIEAAERDARRWRFWRDAAIDEDGAKRAAIQAQPFPATKEQLDAALDAAIAAQQAEGES